MGRLRNLLLAALIATSAIACSSGGSSASKTSGGGLEGIRAKTHFSTLHDLAAAASAVVVATAKTQSLGVDGGAPTTTTTMAITRTLRGQAPHEFRLYQIGRSGSGADFPIVTTGRSYLIFMTPYELTPGTPVAADLYVVLGGGAGLYSASGSSFTHADKESPQLPGTATATDVQAALKP